MSSQEDSTPPEEPINVFAREQAVLKWATQRLSQPLLSGEELKADFAELAKHYSQLLRQSQKIVSLSDNTQHQLRQTTRELREAIAKMDSLNAELTESNEEKDEILGIAAHDLKSPLSGIRGLAGLMCDGTELAPETVYEIADSIRQGTNNMLLMISNLLELYRYESTDQPIEQQKIVLSDLGESLLFSHKVAAQNKQIKLELLAHPADREVEIDLEVFSRIAENLISNAVKFSPRGRVVKVQLVAMETTLTLSVIDQGPGIPPDEQVKLFKKFSKLTTRPTAGESSSGLGLAIVKQLCENLGGSIAVESAPGEGATFKAVIPLS